MSAWEKPRSPLAAACLPLPGGPIMNRKDEHVSAKAFHKEHSNDFDAVRLVHQSFPQIDVADVAIATTVFDRSFSSPFSSMP